MYSPINKIYVKNFRNIGEVELDFTESPIICLVGENEAGKTSLIKAFSVCALHSTPRDQKDYIRDGTQMFGVAILLEDGTKIVRMKTSTVNKYQVTKPDGTTWETTKISEGLPVEVQNAMGLIEEPETKEFLHIRTYEDKLLFVVTPASVNYKVMYNALKVEQLTKAIKSGSNEANQIKGRLDESNASIRTLEGSLSTINIVDMEPLIAVRDRINKQLNILNKLEQAKKLLESINNCNKQLGIVKLIDTFKLSEIDISKSINLCNINKLLNNINNLKDCKNKLNDINNVREIDTNILYKIQNILDKKNSLISKRDKAGSLVHISNINEINERLVVQLQRVNTLNNTIKHNRSIVEKINIDNCDYINTSTLDKAKRAIVLIDNRKQYEESIKSYKQYINQVMEWMKSQGVAFETCPNCGNDVIIDLEKIS